MGSAEQGFFKSLLDAEEASWHWGVSEKRCGWLVGRQLEGV